MRKGSLLGALLLVGALFPLSSCSNSPGLTSIVVSPSVMNFGGPGLTTQLRAIGYYTNHKHPPVTKDITNEVEWKSATPDCVTVSSTGLITSGGNICSGILVMASTQGFNGIIVGSMTVNVTQPTSTGTNVALVVVNPQTPSPQAVGTQLTFTAKGYDGAGNPIALVNPPTWTSSNTGVATIAASGLQLDTANATMVATGTTTISAAYTNTNGTQAIVQPATLTVQ
jgi:hypothetical protein